MQEIQLLLVQIQTVTAQLALQVMAVLALALAWLVLALGGRADAQALANSPTQAAWGALFALVARIALVLGLLWLTVLAVAWPPLLERTGNVLGPIVAALVAIMLLTESLAYRLAQRPGQTFRKAAALLTAVGLSVALALVLLAQSWMREPTGAALIDGRYQVIEWGAIASAPGFAQSLFATLFGALLLVASLVHWAGSTRGATILALPAPWQRGLAGLGVAGLLGILWLLSQSVGATLSPTTQTTQTLYAALLQGSGNWPLRITFVLWIVTLAGLVISLGALGTAGPASHVGAGVARLPVITAPVLWAMVWWQLFVQAKQSAVAGLPVADLTSMQPVPVLAFGLVLVCVVVAVSLWLLVQFLRRIALLAASDIEQFSGSASQQGGESAGGGAA